MEPLANATILYDADCPLCRVYTGAFTRWGFLEKDSGRTPFQQISTNALTGIDVPRAQDEIALLDTHTGDVRYGLDSLLHILGAQAAWIPGVGNLRPVRWILTRLYRFISYNRKVIAAVRPTPGLRTCTPAFNAKYRLVYLLFAWALSATIFYRYAALADGRVSWPLVAAATGGLVAVQSAVLILQGKRNLWDYLGNLMTTFLIGSLLLLPCLWIQPLLPGVPQVFTGYLGLVAGVMLTEHGRRTNLLGLGLAPGATWVLYWAVVLLLF